MHTVTHNCDRAALDGEASSAGSAIDREPSDLLEDETGSAPTCLRPGEERRGESPAQQTRSVGQTASPFTEIVRSALEILRDEKVNYWCIHSVTAIGIAGLDLRDEASVTAVSEAVRRGRVIEPGFAPTLDTLERWLGFADRRDEGPWLADEGAGDVDFGPFDTEEEEDPF